MDLTTTGADALSMTVNSYYNVYDNNPKKVSLEYLLNLESRFTQFKAKAELPCFQPHGIGWGRKKEQLVTHTGLVQLDYDYKDNGQLDGSIFKSRAIDELMDSDFILCAQTSASGKGIWALLMVDGITIDNHKEMADNALVFAIDRFGLIPDEKVSRNLASLRFLSPADDLKVNHEAKAYNI